MHLSNLRFCALGFFMKCVFFQTTESVSFIAFNLFVSINLN